VGDESFHADGDTDRHDETKSTFTAVLKRLIQTILILTIEIFYRFHVFTHQYRQFICSMGQALISGIIDSLFT
jgi:hypothetical protein